MHFLFSQVEQGEQLERCFLYNPYIPLYYSYTIYLYILIYTFIVFFVPLVPVVPLYINKYVIMYVLLYKYRVLGILELALGGTSHGTTRSSACSIVPLYPLTVMPGGGPGSPGAFHFGSCSTFVVPPKAQKVARILHACDLIYLSARSSASRSSYNLFRSANLSSYSFFMSATL